MAAIVKKLNQENKNNKKQVKTPKKATKRLKENLFVSWYVDMWLERLELQHFRNYNQLDIEFHKGLNVF